jgi:hypothetical protein
LTKTALAYIAGIIDGEGSIFITNHTGRSTRLFVAVSNTKFELLDYLRNCFGGSIVTSKRASGLNQKQCWQWQAKDRIAERALKSVFPFLRLKKEQAELALKFRSLINSKQGSKRLTEDELQARKIIRDTISKLNKRGI